MDATILFRVPAAIDLEDSFGDSDRDYAAYLLDTLHRKLVTWRVDQRGFTRLQRGHLTRFIPERRFTRVRAALEEHGVIHVDRSYSVGARSIGYKVDPRYWRSRSITCRNQSLIERIREYREDCERRLLPVHRWLRGKFNRLQFNYALARKIIADMEPHQHCYMERHDYQTLMHETCARFKYRPLFDVDCYGRVHTSITNLHSMLRPCLEIKGQQLTGIDLVSSQPTIAAIVAQRFATSRGARSRMLHRSFEGRATPYVVQEVQAIWEQLGESTKGRRS